MNNFSNMSYTNKDFNSIYSELLQYAKQLSYKWDPTASNESDPAIVLLKLAAIIGDKDNYNIDQNVLELMPNSVSQIPAARQLFDQCGYTMKHYIAAQGNIGVTIVKAPEDLGELVNAQYTLPRFTQITNADSTVVYTTIQETILGLNTSIAVDVIEGTPVNYTINNDPLITMRNIDANNRIYLTDYNIAQNGIFITNSKTPNDLWEQVDNLAIQPKNTKCFKFGLSLDGSTCYVEFPQDVDFLIEDGLNITYVCTSGLSGNIRRRELKQLFSEVTVNSFVKPGETCTLTNEHVEISNMFEILNGKDPESIEEAYQSYQRVKLTCDTLVSTSDYENYLISTNKVSNAFVCDRTNDIQHSYKLLQVSENANILTTAVAQNDDNEDTMLPFDLCIYGLKYVSDVKDRDTYAKTFMLSSKKNLTVDTDKDFQKYKAIQHNFKDFDAEKILLIKNKYPIKTFVIPTHKLTALEKLNVEDNIKTALYKALNSKKLKFGEPSSYDEIYNVILTSDERIKAISLDYPIYETYAMYKDEKGEFQELRIDASSQAPDNAAAKELWNAFRVEIFAKNILCGTTPLYDTDTTFSYGVNQKNIVSIPDVSYVQTQTTFEGEYDNNKTRYGRIEENEQIVLTSPSYIEDTNYSNYVKVYYRLSKSGRIAANSKVKLRNQDYIIFFWKNSDEETDYQFVRYTGTSVSNVISSSFSFEDRSDYDDNIMDSLKSDRGVTTTDVTTYVSNITLNANSSNLDAPAFVLTGTQTIRVFKKNKVDMTSDNNIGGVYWILNNSDNMLFPKCDNCSESHEYTLKSGEYFLYCNASHTTLHTLGEGTKIIATGSIPADLTRPPISYADLMNNGISFLDDEDHRWMGVNFPGYSLSVQEMRLHIIGPQHTLYIEGDTSSTDINSSPTFLTKKRLSYVDETTGVTTNVDYINSDEDKDAWSAYSVLSLNCSNTKPQTLNSRQTIKLYNSNKDEISTNYELPNYVIQTSHNIEQSGSINGSFVYVEQLNAQGNRSPIQFLKYSNAADNSAAGIEYIPSSFQARLTGKDSYTLSFSLLAGTYLLQITSNEDCDLTVTITSEDISIASLLSSESSTASTSHIYKVVANSDCNTDLTKCNLSINKHNVDLTDILLVHPLVKYDSDKLSKIDNNFEANLLTRLSELDSDRKFDYTNIPEQYIANPLESSSFWNKLHCYNPYTISEWEEQSNSSQSDIQITSAIK